MDICLEARKAAEDFLQGEKEYQMGYIEAEDVNEITKNMSGCFKESITEGLKLLISCDEHLIKSFKEALESDNYKKLKNKIKDTLTKGGKIYLSGCGSSGRLCMRVEASFRKAAKKLAPTLENSIETIMTGGDFAIIRAVESFEDYIALGKLQAQKCGVSENDLLIGVTATGETTSILGTAIGALEAGAEVFMVVCSDPCPLINKMERVRAVYTSEKTSVLLLNSGKMALTGSTRMQSSTIEQVVLCAALEEILRELSGKELPNLAFGFERAVLSMKNESYLECMAEELATEEELIRGGGFVTYFANEYVLDILTDTTERAPTFNSIKFRPNKRQDLPLSFEFVKNPDLDTKDVWRHCLGRAPRCLNWGTEEYKNCGIALKEPPEIDLEALYEYEIGREKDAEREAADSLAVWVGLDSSESFPSASAGYKETRVMLKPEAIASLEIMPTCLDIFEHAVMKMTLNNISTGTMARVGKILGNYMICLNISNKKLIDRAARIISLFTKLEYTDALYELFYSKFFMEANSITGSPVEFTVKRIKGDLSGS